MAGSPYTPPGSEMATFRVRNGHFSGPNARKSFYFWLKTGPKVVGKRVKKWSKTGQNSQNRQTRQTPRETPPLCQTRCLKWLEMVRKVCFLAISGRQARNTRSPGRKITVFLPVLPENQQKTGICDPGGWYGTPQVCIRDGPVGARLWCTVSGTATVPVQWFRVVTYTPPRRGGVYRN